MSRTTMDTLPEQRIPQQLIREVRIARLVALSSTIRTRTPRRSAAGALRPWSAFGLFPQAAPADQNSEP